LTVYALIVVPEAHDVFGSHREIGFVTRRVTVWLNGLGAALVAVFAWELRSRRAVRGQWTAWWLAAIAQAFLFAWHPVVDGLLDPATQSIADYDRFYLRHRVYLLASLAQWLAVVWLGLRSLRAWTAAPGQSRTRTIG
jgi:hypothetical protein